MSSQFKETIEYYKNKINNQLDLFFTNKIKDVSELSNENESVINIFNHMKEYTLRGGKRLRPIFFIFGYKCLSNDKIAEVIKTSIFCELMQSFLLIHDDIIDEDPVRRGKLSFHKVMNDQFYEKKIKDSRIGEKIAVIIGDVFETYSEQVLAHSNFKHEYVGKSISRYGEIVEKVGYGQLLDFLSEINNKTSEEDIINFHKLKTASYSIEGPLHIGALLAGANQNDLDILSSYGIPLGIAFQVQDDKLGLFGSEEKIGKRIGSDLIKGKKTLLIIKAIQNGTDKQKKTILNCIGDKNITIDDINDVRNIMIETGSLDYTNKIINDNTLKAIKSIENSHFRNEAKNFLIDMANYIKDRES